MALLLQFENLRKLNPAGTPALPPACLQVTTTAESFDDPRLASLLDKFPDVPEEIRTVYIAFEIRRDAFRHA
jgi:hypothetical protein